MKVPINYALIQDFDTKRFRDTIMEHMKEGYDVAGGVSTMIGGVAELNGETTVIYAQAMVKYQEISNDRE